MDDSLAPAAVAPLLTGRFGREYLHVPECASTQRLLPAGAPEGTVAATDHQTAGRGRRGGVWEDEPGTSLLLSVLLRPAVAPERLPALTLVGAAACADAIRSVTGLPAELKEPNDVLVGGRKVAGVLGEAAEGRVVLGIGVNVNQEPAGLPAQSRLPATSLRIELGAPVARAPLLAELLGHLERRYDAWLSGPAAAAG